VAYNSWINCTSPWQFGVGSNVDQKDVLPASEIRSERPIRTLVANNLIYNEEQDNLPIVAHDSLDGITFKSNIINNQGGAFKHDSEFEQKNFTLSELEENIFVPASDLSKVNVYDGFEFEQITKDLFDTSRLSSNSVGAISMTPTEMPNLKDVSAYGPAWYSPNSVEKRESKTLSVNSVNDLETAVQEATSGDIIVLTSNRYELKSSLQIDKRITIKSADSAKKVIIQFIGAPKTPVFEMNPKGELILEGVHLKGTKREYTFASLQSNMSSLYNLTVTDCEITDFDYVLKGYKYSFSEYIKFKSTVIKNCTNGIELSEEIEDKGEYNAENLLIENCSFENIDKNVIDYYRGGYDESTVGGNLVVTQTNFKGCGSKEENGILLNTYGIINVNLSENTFINNPVQLVARLWGAKNNTHSDNEITNSGELIVQENLPLKLLY
ncbi:MAG: chondroitinase-B domain-containing protein, partial [Bacteroidota bacterium]